MKRLITLALLAALLPALAGCGRQAGPVPLRDIPDTYTLEQAKADGCVVHENGVVTQGGEMFEAFFARAAAGEAGSVRLAFYRTLDPARYAPEIYEEIKDEYPRLLLRDLSFDGENYTIREYEGEEESVRQYAFLLKYEWRPDRPDATLRNYTRYVLTDDGTVAWRELTARLVSSQIGQATPFEPVCTLYHPE